MKTDAEKKEYNQRYYAENREAINLRRRRKYHSDSTFRQKVQDEARDRYRVANVGKNKNASYTLKQLGGVQLFSIQYVEAVSAITQDTVREWEAKGIIPKPTYTDSRGWRLYTDAQVKLLGTAFRNFKNKTWDKVKIKAFLHSEWNA